jgi:hypothetical protein
MLVLQDDASTDLGDMLASAAQKALTRRLVTSTSEGGRTYFKASSLVPSSAMQFALKKQQQQVGFILTNETSIIDLLPARTV